METLKNHGAQCSQGFEEVWALLSSGAQLLVLAFSAALWLFSLQIASWTSLLVISWAVL